MTAPGLIEGDPLTDRRYPIRGLTVVGPQSMKGDSQCIESKSRLMKTLR
jgi:hypothetical protein